MDKEIKQANIAEKAVSFRSATATGRIRLKRETIARIKKGRIEKGDPLAIARVTGILVAKQTSDILALCHPLRIENTDIRLEIHDDSIEVTATVTAHEKTGVEMEALTAVAVALLNIWDVVKPYEKDAKGQYPTTEIESLRVTEKVKKPI
jgi:cyclic pyranopterin phosphate synthase